MKRSLVTLMTLALLALAGCSAAQLQTGFQNLAAADCTSPASVQNFVNQMPPSLLPATQQVFIATQLCIAAGHNPGVTPSS